MWLSMKRCYIDLEKHAYFDSEAIMAIIFGAPD